MSTPPTPGKTAIRGNPFSYTISGVQGAEAYRAKARKNRAALICDQHGVDPTAEITSDSQAHLTTMANELALLTDILGLNPAPNTPAGYCLRCGEQLSISVSREHLRHARVCRARDDSPPPSQPPV